MNPTLLPMLRCTKLLMYCMLPMLLFTTCSDQIETTHTYRAQVPVSMEVAEFRSMQVGPELPKSMSTTGKIYVYGNYLFINEPQNGIHIIDNRNPSSPKNLNFINIPGNVDMAVNGNFLYADSYIDLLAFDISDPHQVSLAARVEDVFPNMFINTERTQFRAYKDTIVTTTSSQQRRHWRSGWKMMDSNFYSLASSSGGERSGGSYGQGGSMARFTLMSGHLYTVDNHDLRLFNVQQADKPIFVNNIPLGSGIETIFPFNNKLFIGSTTGMHIYDASNPSSPERMAVYSHLTACDPVVVNDKYAFVTLRSDNLFCRNGADLLEVIDIQDPYNPRLLKAYDMENPHGLGLSGDNLYVCEGDQGLKSFNVADVMNISNNLMEHIKGKKTYDVIPAPNSLIVTGPDGVCQYDYSVPDKLQLLSCISRSN